MKWSDVPGKQSLFWKLACLLVAFCLLMIWLSWSWGRYMEERNQFLSDEARGTLTGYAAEAEQARIFKVRVQHAGFIIANHLQQRTFAGTAHAG